MKASTTGNITRRELVGAVAAMGALAGTALLGGCSSRADSSSEDGSTNTSKDEDRPKDTSTPSSDSGADTATSDAGQAAKDTLVAVFSWSGNTLAVANRIAEVLPAELFRIEPATPYTEDYDEMLQIAKNEQAANALPEFAGSIPNWDECSTVYLGFPTWWGHLPQIIKTFLAAYDCAGKTIYPFNTHGGSGFASCLNDLAGVCPEADIRDGLSLLGDSVSSSTDEIDGWVSASA